jgi:signal transduction histidine kinase
MRNPLNALLGMQEVLVHYVSEEGKRYLDVSISSCKFLMFLFSDMLDSYQIRAGQFTVAIDRFNIITSG